MADLDAEFGISGYNQPLNNTTTVIWQVPVGRNRRWGSSMSPLADAFAGGWQLTAINTMTSGRPVNLTYSPSAQFSVSGAPTYRPDVVGDIYAADQTIDAWFNPANVVIPTNPTQPFGNAARNAALGPATYVLDMGMHKSIMLTAGSRLEFRIEAFNVFNRTNFNVPNGNRSSTAFGTITSLATPARQIQLGVKFDF